MTSLLDDAALTRDLTDRVGRVGSRRIWIVDPLDGIRELGEPSRTDGAVQVATSILARTAHHPAEVPVR
jgi:3'(2'), 5'-bisphosphate nucleotidase